MPEPERVLTRVRWACGEMMTNDTRTEGQVRHHGTAVVNGPEDEPLDWHQVDWHQAEDDVRRWRQRIFTGLLEPGAMKVARPVLRGRGRSNAPPLSDRSSSLAVLL